MVSVDNDTDAKCKGVATRIRYCKSYNNYIMGCPCKVALQAMTLCVVDAYISSLVKNRLLLFLPLLLFS